MTRRVALMGNPNVGKSTIFNGLTRLRQHTGNWAGVTVSCAVGQFSYGGQDFSAVDLPGIYSFDTRSAEEELTKDFILNEDYDFLLVVCDATCLERGLYLLSQAAGLLEHREEAGPCPRRSSASISAMRLKKRGSGSILRPWSVPWGSL